MRVATWNLYLGADLSLLFGLENVDDLADRIAELREQLAVTRFAERATAMAAVLARERPDVVGLQEVCRWTSTDAAGSETVGDDFLPTLLAELDTAGCAYDAHAFNANFSGAVPVDGDTWLGVAGGNVTLVRRDAGLVVVGEETGTFAEQHVIATGIEGVSFPIVRSWGRVDLDVAGTPFAVVNTHIEAWDPVVRDAQRDTLVADAAGRPGPTAVVGDFNARPHVVGMPPPYVDAWDAADDPADNGAGFTCVDDPLLSDPGTEPSERIDYVWVRDARVVRAWRAGHEDADRTVPHRLRPSDHVCVIADLEAR